MALLWVKLKVLDVTVIARAVALGRATVQQMVPLSTHFTTAPPCVTTTVPPPSKSQLVDPLQDHVFWPS